MAVEYKSKPEIAAQKRVIKLPPAIGDWTAYKPPRVLVKKVKTGLYGFDRLSEKDLDRALFIHYRFAHDFTMALKSDLTMSTELYTVQAEQTTYLNFLKMITGPVVQAKLSLKEFEATVVLDLPLADSLINYALGSRELEPIYRGLTEAENAILLTALEEYFPYYTAAFGNIFEDPALFIVGSPELIVDPTINSSSTFVHFDFEILIADNPPARLMLGYAGKSLKQLLQKEPPQPLDFSRLPSSILNRVRIPLKVTMGKTLLRSEELKGLEVGDVVSLDTSIHSALPVAIGKHLRLLGQPGTNQDGKKIVVRVAGLAEVEEKIKVAPPTVKPLEEEKPKEEGRPTLSIVSEKEEEVPEEEELLEEEEEFPEEEKEEFPEEEVAEEEESPEEELPEEEVEEEEEEFTEEEE